jgi:hypothetical protein
MVVAVALGLVAPAVAHAQLAGVAREVVEEAAEQVARRAGSTAARELAEVGGKAGVREVLEKAAAEGGEGLVRKAAQYGVAHGPVAMRAIGRSPAKMVQALDDLAPGLRPAALRAVEREPQVLTGLVNRYGAEALETATKHPGVGTVIGEKLGAEGLGAARTLTTDQAIVVARHADEIAKLPPAQRAGVMAKLRENAGGVVTFLERHPKTLLTAGGVAVLLGAKDEILGPGGGPGGKPPGLVQRVWQDTVGVVRKPVGMAGAVLVGLVAAWAAGRVWVSWKKRRIEGRVAEARGQAQVERARSGVA